MKNLNLSNKPLWSIFWIRTMLWNEWAKNILLFMLGSLYFLGTFCILFIFCIFYNTSRRKCSLLYQLWSKKDKYISPSIFLYFSTNLSKRNKVTSYLCDINSFFKLKIFLTILISFEDFKQWYKIFEKYYTF